MLSIHMYFCIHFAGNALSLKLFLHHKKRKTEMWPIEKRWWRLPQRRHGCIVQFAFSHNHCDTVCLPVGLRLPLVLRLPAGSLETSQLHGHVGGGGGEAHFLHTNSDFLESGIARSRVALTRPVVTDYMRE